MSKTASPTVIGAFVIVGIALTLVAIVVFGSGRLFRHTAPVIVYFDGSVSGLRVGAPVKFRGIEIGRVKSMRINMTGALREPRQVRIPVVLEIDEGRLSHEGVGGIDLHDRAQVQALVDRGLRAELATESIVTGLRYVALDVKPNTPAVMVADESVPYPEIPPTRGLFEEAPDKINQILTNLAAVDVAKISGSIQTTVDDAHKLLSSPHLARALARLDKVTASLSKTAAQLEERAQDLKPVIKSAHRLVAPEGTLSRQLDATLEEVAGAARSLRRLTDQISRDPGSLLRGGRP